MPLTTLAPSPTSRDAMSIGLLRLDRARHAAGQHDAVADAFDADIAVRERSACSAARTPLRSRVTAMSRPAIWRPSASKKNDAGLPDRDADDVGAPRRADDRVGDLRIGDQHVLDVARQVDHHRLADAERHEARSRVAGGDLDRRRRAASSVGGHALRAARSQTDARNAERQTTPQPRRGSASLWLMLRILSRSFRRLGRGDAEADHVDAVAGGHPSRRPGVPLTGRRRRGCAARATACPLARHRESSAWRWVSSSVAVLPTTTRWPFFSSTVWSMASTRTSVRIVSRHVRLDAG